MGFKALKIALSLGMALAIGQYSLETQAHNQEKPAQAQFIQEAHGIQEYKLQNGLKVLLVENHAAPVATVMVVYRVGSRNEAVGYTGSTHFLEHMLFKGTPRFNKQQGTQIANLLLREGASFNATTWLDRTNYFETLPADKLGLALEIEADRMRNSFIANEDRQSEMTVVRNELERGENTPSRVMWQHLFANAFMAHPYHHPTIGWRSDVEGVPTARLKQFYQDFYYPNNATLIVVGDIDPARTLALINQTFGPIAASAQPIPEVYTAEPPQEGERRFTIKRPGQLGIVNLGFHVPPLVHQDSYALDVLDSLLSKGVTSRLYQALVEKQLAINTYSANIQLRDPGLFVVSATAASGVAHKQVEDTMLAVIEELKKNPPTAKEVAKVKTQIRAEFTFARHGTSELASTLGEYEAMADWRYLVTYLDNLQQVAPQDVQRVAQAYFKPDNRTVGYFIPEKADSVEIKPNPPNMEVKNKPAARQQVAQKTEIKRLPFAKNAVLLVQENHLDNTVAIQGSLRAGSIQDPPDKPGLAQLTAGMLDKGTQKRDKLQVSEALEEMGSSLSFSTDLEEMAFSGRTLGENLDKTLAILYEILKEPAFAKAELEKLKKQRIDQLRQQLENTDAMAGEQLYQALYPASHPHHAKSIETLIVATEKIAVEDVQQFYRRHYGTNKMIIALVGALQSAKVKSSLEQNFKGWNAQNPAEIAIPDVPLQVKGSRLVRPMKDKANISIVLGHQAELKLNSPDYFAALLANHALGRSTLTSRLGLRVRDELGLTYGIFSSFPSPSLGAGPWTVNVTTNPKNVEKTITETLAVVRQYIQEGISERELADAKSSLIGSYLVSLSTNPSISDRLVQIEFYNLGLDYFQRRASLINRVSLKEANAAINKYFHPDRMTISIAGSL